MGKQKFGEYIRMNLKYKYSLVEKQRNVYCFYSGGMGMTYERGLLKIKNYVLKSYMYGIIAVIHP